MTSFLSYVSGGTVDSTVLLSLAIVLCALFLEDVATVIVGVLAADGIVPIPLAFISLYIGIALGDTLFYALGSFARTHPRLAHYIDHDFTAPFRAWLESRYAFTVFSGHFVPGLRSTTYIASGFFRLPLSTYIPMAIAGGLVLLTTLFLLSYWFGGLTSGWVSHARWGIAGIFLLILFFIGRHNLLVYREKRSALSGANNTNGV
ncbi:VTT domain-containing protein [Candidatus Kaiserbacteria bacterium]|nr:VTT domain-containing protein [Candidatus Kaiserbacteria bacterium]